ncbi:oxygenase MpaB family protein [Nocardia sp. NPDC046473]|uniref:oxygenase MpaB family protein n=1 Tax=Nocardia sp. NPDC046473 TaxID=3155733 RepID=UPI0033FCBA43
MISTDTSSTPTSTRVPTSIVSPAGVERARLQYGNDIVDRVIDGMYETDTAADALLEAFAALPGRTGWQLLDTALTEGLDAVPDAPAELRNFLQPLLTPPAWVDLDRVDQGAACYWRLGALVGLSGISTLASSYQPPAVALTLTRTGRLEKMAVRRVDETADWLLKVTVPGGARPGTEGFAAAVKVRLVHATIRRHILTGTDWDTDTLGQPINALHMAMTATLIFLHIPLHAMRDLGVRFTDDELQALIDQWRWIGYLSGAPEHLLPTTAAELEAFAHVSFDTLATPTDNTRQLIEALVADPFGSSRLLPAAWAERLRPRLLPITRYIWTGIAARWMYWYDGGPCPYVAPNLLTPLVPLLRPAIWIRETARRAGLLGTDTRIAQGQAALLRRLMNRMHADRDTVHAEHLTTHHTA